MQYKMIPVLTNQAMKSCGRVKVHFNGFISRALDGGPVVGPHVQAA
jgi:hypothetical protein